MIQYRKRYSYGPQEKSSLLTDSSVSCLRLQADSTQKHKLCLHSRNYNDWFYQTNCPGCFSLPQYTWDIWYSEPCRSLLEFLLSGEMVVVGTLNHPGIPHHAPQITSDQNSTLNLLRSESSGIGCSWNVNLEKASHIILITSTTYIIHTSTSSALNYTPSLQWRKLFLLCKYFWNKTKH